MSKHFPALPSEDSRRLRGPVLAAVTLALMVTLLLEALDQTVVGTAMPRIIGRLHGFDRYTWAVTAYLLASTTLIPVAGKLSDQFGRKWFLLAGVIIFLAGSALCGSAQSIDALIAFRALQGLGAGIGISLVFTAVADIFPPRERAKWQGIVGGVYGFSSVIGPGLGGWLADHGPLLGGWITDDTRWRWVFYINLPLGLAALAVLLLYFPASIAEPGSGERGWAAASRIDLMGATLVAAGTVCLLVGLTWIGEGSASWNSPRVAGVLGAALLLSLAFIAVEYGALEPILPLDLFRNPVFASDCVLSLLLYMTLFGMAFFVPLFLQGVLATSPTTAGAVMTPFSVSIVAGNVLAGLAISRLARYHGVTLGGTLIMAAGIVLLERLTPSIALLQVSVYAVTAGFGMGILFTATSSVVGTVLAHARLGVGFATVRFLGQIGGTLGVAVVGTVVNHSLTAELHHRVPATLLTRLAADGVRLDAGPQVLVNPAYRAGVVRAALREAAARVPAGSGHDAVAAATRRELRVLDGAFEALRLSLAVAIQHGMIAVLLFSAGAILAAWFVRDPPAADRGAMERSSDVEANEGGAVANDLPANARMASWRETRGGINDHYGTRTNAPSGLGGLLQRPGPGRLSDRKRR